MAVVSLFVLILAAFATPIWSARVKFTSLECRSVDPTFCVIDKCTMKPLGRDVKDAVVIVKLLQTPVTNVTFRGEIRRRGNFDRPLFTCTIDACRFLDTENRNPIANVIYKFLRMDIYSNMNHSCPFDHDLIVDHLLIDNTYNLPLPIGLGDFTIKTYWSAYNVLRGTVTINIAVV